MAVNVIAHANSPNNASNEISPVSTPARNTAGATVYLVVVSWILGTISSCTDNLGNTYTRGNNLPGDGSRQTTSFRCLNPTTGPSVVVSVAGVGNSGFLNMRATFVAFDPGTPVFDTQNAGAAGGQAGSLTPNHASNLFISIFGGNIISGPSIDSGFTIAESVQWDASNHTQGCALAYLEQSSATAQNPTWNGGGGAGLTAGSIILQFTNPVPAPTSVTPNTGTVLGGTPVTIAGSGFTGTTGVTFGGVAATSVVVGGGGNSITCVTPAHAVGAVDVVVTSSFGSGTLTNGFTYFKPPATLHPTKGIRGYKAEIFLESVADNFTPGTSAVVSGTGVTVDSCTVVDATHLIINITIAPNATLGARDITVTIP